MFYKIVMHPNSKNIISMPVDLLKNNHNLLCKTRITLYFGGRKSTVDIAYDSDLQGNNLQLSEDVAKELCIPCNMNYQIKIMKDGIRIGPVIGLLLRKYKRYINVKSADKFLEYTFMYPKFQGLFYIFSEEGIDPTSKTIEGIYLKPDINNKKILWEKAMLPYPSAIYRRITLPEAKIDFLKDITNNNMFNSYFFDKWEFWQFISSYNQIKDNIPDTCLLESLDTIDDMLNKHKMIYLKLVNGSLAYGILRVWKEDGKYYFRSKYDSNPKGLEREEAESFLKELDSKYLVQQGIECLKYNERYIDFRVIMQKDHTKLWNCTGIVSSFGMRRGTCSNYQDFGYGLSFEKALARMPDCDDEFVFKKRQEVIRICKTVCELLDLTEENYGDFGIDVALDVDFNVWVLEINKRHYHTVPLTIDDVQMYYDVKTNPIKYALALSGFPNYQ